MRKKAYHYLLLAVLAVTFAVCGLANAASRDISREPSTRAETLCHVSPGNPDIAHTIVVSQWAVSAHLAHGDTMGECTEECVGPPAPVAKTGQTRCWRHETGLPISCNGTGQDGEFQAGVSVKPRFTDNGDGTVTDNLTGLVWLRDANCFGDWTWTDALSAANTLADGSCDLTDGSVVGDWRLPNLRELLSLIDYQESFPALPKKHPFSRVRSSSYWSSTSSARNPDTAWFVLMLSGNIGTSGGEGEGSYVWPVRGGL